MKIELSKIDLPQNDLRATVDEDALDELAASLRDHGQLQPIGVKAIENDRYEVVFGARRTRAAMLLNWKTIEATFVAATTTNNPNASKLIENVQRLDMTPIEEAYGLLDLIGEGEANIRKLQMQTGKSRDWVRNRLDLIDLPDDLQGAIQAGVIGVGVAKAFGQISSPQVREHYVKMAIENGCTTDQAIVWAGQAKYAETGIMTMDEIQRTGSRILDEEPPAQMHYSCFICQDLSNWRRTTSVIICANCQNHLVDHRAGTPAEPPPTHLTDVLEIP